MPQASRQIPLQERFAARKSKLHISEIVEQEPPSEYDSVGLELQAHRTRKGHELEMASRVLRIRLGHLKAIEDDHFEALPGRTYAVGFVRAYAEYLGLDPEDCVRRFKLEYAAVMEPKEEAARKAKSGPAFADLREDARLPTGSFIVLTGLLILGVWGGWYLSTADERAFSDQNLEDEIASAEGLPTPEEVQALLAGSAELADEALVPGEEIQETPVLEDIVPEPAPEPAPEPVSEIEAVSEDAVEAAAEIAEIPTPQLAPASGARDSQVFGAANHDARVILRARGNTWLRIEGEDGSVLFEQTLQRGDSYRVPNQNGLIMATRNAGAVEMIVDGSSLGAAGNIGQPLLDQTLDANVLVAAAAPRP